MDEVFVKINGVGHYLWRAVDQEGVVLDVVVQRRRDAAAAKGVLPQAGQGPTVRAADDRH
jgi:transposase-like protein